MMDEHNEHDPDHVHVCGNCAAALRNLARIGRAAALRNRPALEQGARWFAFSPYESPTLSAADLDLRSEFTAGQIAAIAREAVRPSFTGPPR